MAKTKRPKLPPTRTPRSRTDWGSKTKKTQIKRIGKRGKSKVRKGFAGPHGEGYDGGRDWYEWKERQSRSRARPTRRLKWKEGASGLTSSKAYIEERDGDDVQLMYYEWRIYGGRDHGYQDYILEEWRDHEMGPQKKFSDLESAKRDVKDRYFKEGSSKKKVKRNPSDGAQGRTVWKAMRTKKRFTIKQAAKATGMSETKARTGIDWLRRYGYVQPMGEEYAPSRGSFRVNPDKPPPASWKFKGPVLSKDHPGAGFRHYGETARPKKKAKVKRKPRGKTVLQSRKAGHQTVGYIDDEGFFVAASEIEEIDPGMPNPSRAPTGRDKEIWGAAEGLIHDVETQKYRAKMAAALKRYKQQGSPNADVVVRKFILHILSDSKYSLENSAKKARGPGAKEARAILKKVSKGIANKEPRSHLDKYSTIAEKIQMESRVRSKRDPIIFNATGGASSAAISYVWGYIPENSSELVGLIISGDDASVKAGHPFPMALIDYTNALVKFMREAERSGGRLRVVGNPKKKAKKKNPGARCSPIYFAYVDADYDGKYDIGYFPNKADAFRAAEARCPSSGGHIMVQKLELKRGKDGTEAYEETQAWGCPSGSKELRPHRTNPKRKVVKKASRQRNPYRGRGENLHALQTKHWKKVGVLARVRRAIKYDATVSVLRSSGEMSEGKILMLRDAKPGMVVTLRVLEKVPGHRYPVALSKHVALKYFIDWNPWLFDRLDDPNPPEDRLRAMMEEAPKRKPAKKKATRKKNPLPPSPLPSKVGDRIEGWRVIEVDGNQNDGSVDLVKSGYILRIDTERDPRGKYEFDVAVLRKKEWDHWSSAKWTETTTAKEWIHGPDPVATLETPKSTAPLNNTQLKKIVNRANMAMRKVVNPPKSKTKKVPWSARDIKGMQEFADRKTGSNNWIRVRRKISRGHILSLWRGPILSKSGSLKGDDFASFGDYYWEIQYDEDADLWELYRTSSKPVASSGTKRTFSEKDDEYLHIYGPWYSARKGRFSSFQEAEGKVPKKDAKHWITKPGVKAKRKSTKKPAKKKVTRKKTPAYQLLINRCQKLWTHYCERPSKKRLEALYVHLDKMKESTSKKVATERSRCLRAANAEAKKLKYKRK